MASNPSQEPSIKQGQQGLATTQHEKTDNPGKEALDSEGDRTNHTKERIESKDVRKKGPTLTMSLSIRERTKTWVETQIAPAPSVPAAVSTTPNDRPNSIEKHQNAEVRKYLVVGLQNTPAKQATSPAKNAITPMKIITTSAKKTPRLNSTTDKPPITITHKGPGLGKFAGPARATPPGVNAQENWRSPEIEGEWQFNMAQGRRLAGHSSPARGPVPMRGMPRRIFGKTIDSLDKAGPAYVNVYKDRKSGMDEEVAEGESG